MVVLPKNVKRITFSLFLIWITFNFCQISAEISQDKIGFEKSSRNETKMSRRKRYIIFPEGSSFQLVYCLTMPTYGIGRIFTMGLTAALAWQLPSEPIHLNGDDKEKDDKEMEKNEMDKETKPMNIPMEIPMAMDIDMEKNKDDKTMAENRIDIFKRPFIPQSYGNFYGSNYKKVVTYQFRQDPKNPVHFIPMGNVETTYIPAYKNSKIYYENRHIHRRTRRDLFEKIEKFFMAQNKDGRACLLKAVCEVNQKPKDEHGNFVEEIIKAIFTWIPDETFDPGTSHIDDASTYKKNCSEKYRQCEHSVFNVFF